MNTEFKATAYDSNNNVIKCDECPNQASFHVIGERSSVNLCSEHSPYANQPEAKIIYRPPSDSEKYEGAPLVKDVWTIDLRSHKGD
jgi:hypothetical protein